MGSFLGVVLGTGGTLIVASHLDAFRAHTFTLARVGIGELVPIMLLGVGVATVAALIPARTASRMPALRGARGPPPDNPHASAHRRDRGFHSGRRPGDRVVHERARTQPRRTRPLPLPTARRLPRRPVQCVRVGRRVRERVRLDRPIRTRPHPDRVAQSCRRRQQDGGRDRRRHGHQRARDRRVDGRALATHQPPTDRPSQRRRARRWDSGAVGTNRGTRCARASRRRAPLGRAPRCARRLDVLEL